MPAFPEQAILIINPAAGTGRSYDVLKLKEVSEIKSSVTIETVFSKSAGDIFQIAKSFSNTKKLVFIAGGDGSVQEAAKGVKDSMTSLGILPCGSGNGLARHLKIDLRPSVALRQLLFYGRTIKADMVNINDQLFINVAGVGFDGLISREFSLDGNRGLKTYIKHIIRNFFNYPEFEYKLDTGNQILSGNAWMISFANGSEFGNGARIAPQASMQDGLAEIVIIRKPGIFQLPAVIWKLRNGLSDSKMIKRFQVKSFSLSFENPLDLHLDGEYAGKTLEVKGSVIPGCISLIVPQKAGYV